jgi:uncharacterized protein (DUF1499 family)
MLWAGFEKVRAAFLPTREMTMQFAVTTVESAASRWSSRIALFSLGILITAAFLHRLFGMPTPVAFNLAAGAYIGVALSLLAAFVAAISIWRQGVGGTARIVFAVSLDLLLLSIPLMVMAVAKDTPPINDVTTDPVSPPRFETVATMRPLGSNSTDYPGAGFAAEQARSYPDLKPMLVDRSADETFELAVEAVKRLKMSIVREQAPEPERGEPGMVEAVDRTLVMGFYEDVAIRVSGDEERAKIDIRSASRFGRSDLGGNAERVRALMREIVARIDATMPAAEEVRAKRQKLQTPLKRGKGDDPTEGRRKSRDRAR